jgi:Fe-S cluster assembly iron-binding protein IscA
MMLTLTEKATDVVKTITEQTTEGDTAGLRISQQASDPNSLGLTPVETPQPGDQVVEADGARVYLDPTAAIALSNEVLDAQVDEAGTVQFGIGAKE